MSQSNTRPHVIFFEVASGVAKLKKISNLALSHFEKGETLLILVKDDTSAKYVDEWLWKYPEALFIPHKICTTLTDEKIIISTSLINNHSHLLNLCPSPISLAQEYPLRFIYEFEDPSSQDHSKKKFHYYKEQRCSIEALVIE